MKYLYAILISLTFPALSQNQFIGLGSEIKSKTNYSYGTFEAEISPSDNPHHTTSFFLYSNNKHHLSFVGFDISNGSIKCYTKVNDKEYVSEFIIKTSKAKFSISWDTHKIKWLVGDSLLSTLKDTMLIPKDPKQIYLSIWRADHSNNNFSVADTTLCEISSFSYQNGSTTQNQIMDDFKTFNNTLWIKSQERYLENILTNDSSLVVHEAGKVQLISLSFKQKTKGIFKRDVDTERIPQMIHATYSMHKNIPIITVSFADTIYVKDKHVTNFEIDGYLIKKSSLKSNLKTVVLYLDKEIDNTLTLKYFPIVGRFRKAQVLEIKRF